jgi:hypothetical protein
MDPSRIVSIRCVTARYLDQREKAWDTGDDLLEAVNTFLREKADEGVLERAADKYRREQHKMVGLKSRGWSRP